MENICSQSYPARGFDKFVVIFLTSTVGFILTAIIICFDPDPSSRVRKVRHFASLFLFSILCVCPELVRLEANCANKNTNLLMKISYLLNNAQSLKLLRLCAPGQVRFAMKMGLGLNAIVLISGLHVRVVETAHHLAKYLQMFMGHTRAAIKIAFRKSATAWWDLIAAVYDTEIFIF